MTLLPPGTILQHMYLRERLRKFPRGRFIEIGPGAGDITSLLLKEGWVGRCYDLNRDTIENLEIRFKSQLETGDLHVLNANFLQASASETEKVHLVISCMVMEHLDESEQAAFLSAAENMLVEGGSMIAIVPASPAHWGIEDDIAGHYRRYTREAITTLLTGSSWELKHISGLTFPVSNGLLPISNYLVARHESDKKDLSMQEKTRLSGARKVFFKTNFPRAATLVLNRIVMSPFHWLQKIFSDSKGALVIYFEATPLKATL